MFIRNQTTIPLKIAFARNIDHRKDQLEHSCWNANLLSIRMEGVTRILQIQDVIFCKSDSNYSTIYIENGDAIYFSKPLKYLESKLPFAHFRRVHQSYLIRLSAIRRYVPSTSQIELCNQQKIPVSRAYKSQIKQLLNF